MRSTESQACTLFYDNALNEVSNALEAVDNTAPSWLKKKGNTT